MKRRRVGLGEHRRDRSGKNKAEDVRTSTARRRGSAKKGEEGKEKGLVAARADRMAESSKGKGGDQKRLCHHHTLKGREKGFKQSARGQLVIQEKFSHFRGGAGKLKRTRSGRKTRGWRNRVTAGRGELNLERRGGRGVKIGLRGARTVYRAGEVEIGVRGMKRGALASLGRKLRGAKKTRFGEGTRG